MAQPAMSFHTRYSGYGKWWWYTPKHKWLEIHGPHTPAAMPQVPACYALVLDGEVVYVGQTLNLQNRFYSHQIKHDRKGNWLTKWGVLPGDLRLKVKFGQRFGDWCMREARLIDRLQPRFNKRLI